MLVIAGLGNPGPRYAHTRHNIGATVLERLAVRLGAPGWREQWHGEAVRVAVGQTPVLLLRPMTFMNESGRAVQAALGFFRVPAHELVVVHDELDLPFGTIRFKKGGGHAGHNGLKSIVAHVGSGDFVRLRVGIGRPEPGFLGDMADYVLSDFPAEQREQLPQLTDRAVDALLDLLQRGLAAATNVLNTRPRPIAEQKSDSPSSEGLVEADKQR